MSIEKNTLNNLKAQENIINNEVNPISAESLALLNSIDYEKPLKADDFKNIANNYEYWIANTSAEKRAKVREQMTETQKGKKSKVLGILEKLLEDPNYVFSEEEKATLNEFPEVLEKLNIDKDTYKSTDDGKKLKETQKARFELQVVIKRLAENGQLTEENFKKSIEAKDKRAEIAELQGIDIAETVKSYYEKSTRVNEQLETKLNEEVEQLSFDELETIFSTPEASMFDIGEIGKSTGLSEISSNELENYFDFEFASIGDPALGSANIELEGNVNEVPENNFTEITAEEPEEVTQEQPEEPAYEAPTIEVEKKGLAKWFDKLKQSRNPLARLITGQLGKKKDNLLLNEANDKIYEDKPSTGRFDATDSQLMPAGKGSRNSIIQVMEKLFKRTSKHKEPEQVIQPITPKNAFDERYVVDTSSLGNNNIIVPNSVKINADNNIKQTETPTKKDDGWSK